MSDEWLDRAEAEAVAAVEPAKRRIELRLVKWGEVTGDTHEGIRETFARGAFSGVDVPSITLEAQRHGGPIVGAAEALEEREDGAYATFRVIRTRDGDDLLEAVSPGPDGEPPALRAASIYFRPITSRDRAGVVERQSVDLAAVAILPRGAYKSAQVMAVRSADTGEVPNVSSPAIIQAPIPDAAAIDAAIVAAEARISGELEQRFAAFEARSSVPMMARNALPFRSLGEYAQAVFRGDIDADWMARTWADQITSQNDGVNQSAWIMDVKRIVDLGRPAVTAFGGARPLPETGMNVVYPFLTSSNTLVAVQSTQKTEIQSARVDIDDQSTAIATYAGGSDISIQLLERSTPSYLEAYQRIMTAYWANVTDAAFVTALEAGSVTQTLGNSMGAPVALATSAHADDIFDTGAAHGFAVGDAIVFSSLTGGDATTAALVNRVVWVTATSFGAQTFRPSLTPGGAAITWGTADISAGNVHLVDTTAASLRASLFRASITVQLATGRPANVVLAATDVFTALGALSDIIPANSGPSNASGTGQASTLRMNVSGLEIIHDPNVTAGKMIVSNDAAAAWHEDGPRWIDAPNAQKLGRDKSIYSFGAGIVYVPAAVVEVTFA